MLAAVIAARGSGSSGDPTVDAILLVAFVGGAVVLQLWWWLSQRRYRENARKPEK